MRQFADQLMCWVKNHTEKTFHLFQEEKLKSFICSFSGSTLILNYGKKFTFGGPTNEWFHPMIRIATIWELMKPYFSKIDIHEANIHRIKGENDPISEVISYTTFRLKKESKKQMDVNFWFNSFKEWEMTVYRIHFSQINWRLINSDNVYDIAIHPQSGQKESRQQDK